MSITTPYRGESPLADEFGRLGYRDKDVLEECYYERKMSQREIGDGFNVAKNAIQKRMARYDLPTRPRGGGNIHGKPTPWQNERVLSNTADNSESKAEISRKLGCDAKTVDRWLDELDVDFESKYE